MIYTPRWSLPSGIQLWLAGQSPAPIPQHWFDVPSERSRLRSGISQRPTMFDCKKVSTSISIISSLWLILDPNSPESSYYWLYHLYNSNLHQFILVYHHLKPQCFRRYRFFFMFDDVPMIFPSETRRRWSRLRRKCWVMTWWKAEMATGDRFFAILK